MPGTASTEKVKTHVLGADRSNCKRRWFIVNHAVSPDVGARREERNRKCDDDKRETRERRGPRTVSTSTALGNCPRAA